MQGRDITVGRYLAGKTVLHGVDPRLKIAAVLVGSVMVFLYADVRSLLAFSGLLFLILILSRMPLLKILASLRTVWVIVVVTALLQFFLTPGEVIGSWGFLTVTDSGVYNGVVFSSRVVMLVILISTLIMTTSPLQLADGLQSLLSPFKYLAVPVAGVTTVVSITLTFIPGILDQSHKIVRAQAARGADFDSWNVLRRVRDIVPVLVPLFVKVFHDSGELATAMDARAYSGGEGRTQLYPMKIKATETLLTLSFVGLAVGFRFIF